MNRMLVLLVLCLSSLAPTGIAFAQTARPGAGAPATSAPSALPDWDHLSPTQREAIIDVVRERWNRDPGQRQRMLQHAERWRQMTPEQRRRAMQGQRRWEQMTPEERQRARAAYEQSHGRSGGDPALHGGRGHMREALEALPPAERETLRQRLQSMTPEQRREWIRTQRAQRKGMR